MFERVLAQTPESGIPLANLGVLALQRDDLAAARQAFEHAIKVDPHSSQAFGGLGVVFVRTGDRARAVDAWKEAFQLDAMNFDALYNIGTTLARDGQRDAARPYLEQFVRTAPPAFYAKDIRDLSELLKRQRSGGFTSSCHSPFAFDQTHRAIRSPTNVVAEKSRARRPG